ncbi:hypothetical protein G4O51_12495 [Candidatus Bathyarchaeota archaeon A05DMB-2]|jgi:hypothetical protein|nr:hypothetical protein [Candidatus Bathyarchaeota archaeon A05DMB-2]
MVKWTLVLDTIQDTRGSVGMFMFILEESCQTMGMACYLLQKTGKWAELKSMAEYMLTELIEPALEFVSIYGHIAYPWNLAYQTFFESAKKTAQTYIQIASERM